MLHIFLETNEYGINIIRWNHYYRLSAKKKNHSKLKRLVFSKYSIYIESAMIKLFRKIPLKSLRSMDQLMLLMLLLFLPSLLFPIPF